MPGGVAGERLNLAAPYADIALIGLPDGFGVGWTLAGYQPHASLGFRIAFHAKLSFFDL
jgi:hypothetical protein